MDLSLSEPIPVDDTIFNKVLAALDQSLHRCVFRLKHCTGVIKLVESEDVLRLIAMCIGQGDDVKHRYHGDDRHDAD